MNQFQIDPLAISAGLLMPKGPLGEEPRLTDAGMFFILGALAYDDDTDPEVREYHSTALSHVLAAAKNSGLDSQTEALLRALLAGGVDPQGPDDRCQLLAVLCRLVAVLVGPGRMGALMSGEPTH